MSDTKEIVKSEVEDYAKFDIIRYAQVWEDADILIEALDIKEDDNILSIASAGENAISMLIKNPNKVYAIDLNANQIACVEFKIACYKYLEYRECMELMGVFYSENRMELYKKIRDNLSEKTRKYFDENLKIINNGIINCGKFENYFRIFREKVLPIIHNKNTRKQLLEEKSKEDRKVFYDKKWNNLRWKMAFRLFFSKTIMGKLGRDKAFFRYVNVNVAEHILERTKYAITELDTFQNPYLQYIVTGKYDTVFPVAYRKDNFEIIKNNIDKIILLPESIETFIERDDVDYISKCNFSDIFEYMSEEEMCKIIEKLLTKLKYGSKIAYWNMLSEKRASKFIEELKYKKEESEELFKKDKAFFYSDFIVEQFK